MNTFLFLKIIAFITMIIDHYGAIIDNEIFRIVGRISFPIFCMLLSYGCIHTKKPIVRIIKLFICAVISQPIYLIVFGMDSHFNIIMGYALFALVIYMIRKINMDNIYLEILLMGLLMIVCEVCNIDYGWFLIALCYIFYKINDTYLLCSAFIVITLLCSLVNKDFLSIWTIENYAIVDIPLIVLFQKKVQNNKIHRKVYKNKVVNFFVRNAFYILYPLHLLIFAIVM